MSSGSTERGGATMRLRLIRSRDYLRESLWFIPAVAVVGALLLAVVLARVDRRLDADATAWYLFDGGTSGARELVSTIAMSMLTLTGVVFSITMLVLQLAGSQLSGRVMRTFLRDRNTQIVLALFLATFAYALFSLREIRSPEDNGTFVPSLTIWFSFILVLACVGAFVHYINHMAQSIRPATVITVIARETRDAIDRLYPEDLGEEPAEPPAPPEGPPDRIFRWPKTAGVLVAVNEDALFSHAVEHDCVLELVPLPGDFVPNGGVVIRAWGGRDDPDDSFVTDAISVSGERTLHQDAGAGVRQLVDIAERALSPSLNDPTTAVQALDQIHDLLRRLAGREFPSRRRLDEDGRLRVIAARPEWDDYVHLALDEIRRSGTSSIQIVRRLRHLLEDLLEVAPLERQPVLRRHLSMLESGLDASFDGTGDRRLATRGSRQGHGP